MYSDGVASPPPHLGTPSSVTGLTDVQIMMNLVKNVEVNIEFIITTVSFSSLLCTHFSVSHVCCGDGNECFLFVCDGTLGHLCSNLK